MRRTRRAISYPITRGPTTPVSWRINKPHIYTIIKSPLSRFKSDGNYAMPFVLNHIAHKTDHTPCLKDLTAGVFIRKPAVPVSHFKSLTLTGIFKTHMAHHCARHSNGPYATPKISNYSQSMRHAHYRIKKAPLLRGFLQFKGAIMPQLSPFRQLRQTLRVR